MAKKLTKQNYEKYLNELGAEGAIKESRCRNLERYGSWLRVNDPIAFEVAFREHLCSWFYTRGAA